MLSSPEHGMVTSAAAELILNRLSDALPAVTRSIHEGLYRELSELAGGGELQTLLHDTVQGNLDTLVSALRHGIPLERIDAPTAALEHARRMAQRGVELDVLIRGYRLGHQALLKFILAEVSTAQLDTQLGWKVFDQLADRSFEYNDWISHLVVGTYQAERDRWLANQSPMLALHVGEVLTAGDIDINDATTLIGYPLNRSHVALVVWCNEREAGNELDTMQRFIADLAASFGAERPLFVATDRTTAWAWIPLASHAVEDVPHQIRRRVAGCAFAPSLAVGDPRRGLAGFRQSHREAMLARAVVLASASPGDPVTAASDPGLVVAGQFSSDLGFARSWVRDVLGPLASATDGDERMRETLREFLRAGSSPKAAAEHMHLHVNSVKYRVQRAIDRRGRPIDSDRTDVEVALLLCHWFGGTVLQ